MNEFLTCFKSRSQGIKQCPGSGSVRIHWKQCKAKLYCTFSNKNFNLLSKNIENNDTYNTEEKDKSIKTGNDVEKNTKFPGIPTCVTHEVGSGSRSVAASRHEKRCRCRFTALLGRSGSASFWESGSGSASGSASNKNKAQSEKRIRIRINISC